MSAVNVFLIILGTLLLCVILFIVTMWAVRSFNLRRFAFPAQPDGGEARILEETGVRSIERDYLRGFHLTPQSPPRPGTVVIFGGSEGGANVKQAQVLRDNGYDVMALYFFGQPGQKEKLDEVPLEFFAETIDYAEENGNGIEPLTVIGTSKGAELTANLATRYRDIDNIVLYAPADYTYGALTFDRESGTRSSFTWKGEPVPFAAEQGANFVSFMFRLALALPISYRAGYEANAAAADESAAIDLTNFNGHGLLFAGTDDTLWQSPDAARNLAAQNSNLEPHIYDGAGHLFDENIAELIGPSWEVMMGGTVAANREAKRDSDEILLNSLAQWHGPAPAAP